MALKPWTFFAVALAGWMNRQQQEVIEFLREENRVVREKLGSRQGPLFRAAVPPNDSVVTVS